jgi:hypothetical protein
LKITQETINSLLKERIIYDNCYSKIENRYSKDNFITLSDYDKIDKEFEEEYEMVEPVQHFCSQNNLTGEITFLLEKVITLEKIIKYKNKYNKAYIADVRYRLKYYKEKLNKFTVKVPVNQ